MLKLVKIQFRSANFKRFNLLAISLTIIFILIATIFRPDNLDISAGIYQISIMFLMILFFNLENNKTNIILNSLPINKKSIVLKNYIYIFIALLLVNLYNYISFYIINNTYSIGMECMDLIKFIIGISIITIQVSLILPILHLVSGVFSYFIVYIFNGIGLAIIISRQDSIENMMGSGNLYILPVIAFLIMALSIAVSIFFYTHREFEGVVE